MRYGIFSDIHANLEALERVIEAYKKERIDRYLCVGDIVGYAANPCECIEKVKELVSVIVAGNHDWASVGKISIEYFNSLAKKAILWTERNLSYEDKQFLSSLSLIYKKDKEFTLVHGTLDKPEKFDYCLSLSSAQGVFSLLETELCFIGHTHHPGVFIEEKGKISYMAKSRFTILKDNRYIINVGSVGQPRDANPQACFCIYDTEQKLIELRRLDYDIKTTQDKILSRGLPPFLAMRLSIGK